ncbi:hypothetical protein Ade02nite_81320 [Paractinoplanes deccanensis]|uniref:Uncharacterized protein n=1 Tax=Paractinoplanes deccanensis TaxID=113561 RepID=A0ABQ3YHK1_9ACTN|nr:hypothetical protein [Actinoplanes deccanensis]GID79491.1 hypothetical protein Ade02nite_81320 [Actinoplanes deccanensis]
MPYQTGFATLLDFREATERVREQLRVWLQQKRYDVDRFDAGEAGLSPGVVIRYAATNDVSGWQLQESRHDGVTWVSTVAVTRGVRRDHAWISLNVEPVVSGSASPPQAAPPKLVRLLLGAVDAVDGEATLRPHPMVVNAAGVDDLLEIVCAEERRLPVVVAAAPTDVPFDRWRATVNSLVRYLPGLASTYLLDPVAVPAFNDGIGVTYAIGPGAVRTYLPSVDPAISEDSVRHRVLSRWRIEKEPARAARVLGVLPRQLAAAALPAAAARGLNLSVGESRRARDEPAGETTSLRAEVKTLTELLAIADDTEQQLREAASRHQEQVLDLAADLEIAQAELERRSATVRELQRRLVEAQMYDLAYSPVEAPPPLPTSFADLLDRLNQLTDHVVFTGNMETCLDLDEQMQSSAWAQTGWQGLLALADYAAASTNNDFAGDFKTWCESPPNGRYAISAGKVARDESPTVRNNAKFSATRVFPVPESVSPSCEIFMGAHIKLGNSTTIAPRMHFLDALRRDGHIYVGYIGPHLPNTLT